MINIDLFIQRHNLSVPKIVGLVVAAVIKEVDLLQPLYVALSTEQLFLASTQYALEPVLGQEERLEHLRAQGHLLAPQKTGQTVSVNNTLKTLALSSSSTSASPNLEKGLPVVEVRGSRLAIEVSAQEAMLERQEREKRASLTLSLSESAGRAVIYTPVATEGDEDEE